MASLAKKSMTLPGMQSDWEIDPDELEIANRPDGSEWRLGSGASAHVKLSLSLIKKCPLAHLAIRPIWWERCAAMADPVHITALPELDHCVSPPRDHFCE